MKKKIAQICLWVAVFASIINALYFAISLKQYAMSACFGIGAILLVLGGRSALKNE